MLCGHESKLKPTCHFMYPERAIDLNYKINVGASSNQQAGPLVADAMATANSTGQTISTSLDDRPVTLDLDWLALLQISAQSDRVGDCENVRGSHQTALGNSGSAQRSFMAVATAFLIQDLWC